MTEEIQEQEPRKKEEYHLFERFWVAFKGSLWRNVLRAIGGIGSLIFFGLYGFICVANHWGNSRPPFLTYLLSLPKVLWFSIQRGTVLLWDLLFHINRMDLLHNWGDLAMIIIVFLASFAIVYWFVSIPMDAFDGSVKDKSPIIWKILASLGILILVSFGFYVLTPKPDTNWEVNSHLFMDDYGREVCKTTGKIPLFLPKGSENPYQFEVNETINQSEVQVI